MRHRLLRCVPYSRVAQQLTTLLQAGCVCLGLELTQAMTNNMLVDIGDDVEMCIQRLVGSNLATFPDLHAHPLVATISKVGPTSGEVSIRVDHVLTFL